MSTAPLQLHNQSLAPVAPLPLGERALAEYLNAYKRSTLRTVKVNLAMVVDLIAPDPNKPKRRPAGESEARIRAFDWTRLNRAFVKTVLRRAQDHGYSASTINSLLIVCRGIAEELWELKLLSADELKSIEKVGSRMKGKGGRVRTSKPVEDAHFLAMLAACAKDEKKLRGLRDATLLTLAAGSGCRAAELIGLRVKDVDFDAGTVKVTGKGDNERIVYVAAAAMTALRRWLETYAPINGVLFPAWLAHEDKPIPHRAGVPMSYNALYDLVRQRALQAGVPVVSPHSFRHWFAGKTYEATGSMFAVQQQLGHSQSTTTERYLSERVAEQAKQNAAASWTLPNFETT